jgi:hypothetical protein
MVGTCRRSCACAVYRGFESHQMNLNDNRGKLLPLWAVLVGVVMVIWLYRQKSVPKQDQVNEILNEFETK